MSEGTANPFGELRRHFDLVCDLPPEAREAALRTAGATEAMVAEVMALLVADAATFEALEDTVLVRIEELLALNGRTTSLAEIPVQILGRAIVSGRQSRGTILNG